MKPPTAEEAAADERFTADGHARLAAAGLSPVSIAMVELAVGDIVRATALSAMQVATGMRLMGESQAAAEAATRLTVELLIESLQHAARPVAPREGLS